LLDKPTFPHLAGNCQLSIEIFVAACRWQCEFGAQETFLIISNFFLKVVLLNIFGENNNLEHYDT